MCEYCDENIYPKKYLIERNTYSSHTDSYIGVGVAINGNILEIEAVGEVGYPSKDTTYVEDNKEINYCPMCGKNLKEGDE